MFLDLLKQELGTYKEAGEEIRFNCPFCGETKYKLYVHSEKGLWICFKCSEKGNPVTFVKQYYNVSYIEAVDILATYDYDVHAEQNNRYTLAQYGSDLDPEEQLLLFISREGEPIETIQEIRYVCPPTPTNCKSLMANFNNPEAFPFFQYLHNRGVTLEKIKTHHISYVTHGTVTLTDGRQMELNNHLVFFTFDDRGNPIYWNTRSIDPNPFIKSFNAPSKDNEYSKNNTIFNLNNAKHTDKIVVTEGVFDALTIPNNSGVATFGKKITEMQIDLLVEAANFRNIPIYLFLDSDAQKEVNQALERLQSRVNAPIYIVFNDTDMDANDLGPIKCQELIDKAIKADSQGQLLFNIFNL